MIIEGETREAITLIEQPYEIWYLQLLFKELGSLSHIPATAWTTCHHPIQVLVVLHIFNATSTSSFKTTAIAFTTVPTDTSQY